MTAENQLNTVLSTHSGLSALVQTRISPMKAIQRSALPCVTYANATGCAVEYTHDGPIDMRDPVFQIDSWGRTYDEARAVNEQVLQALFNSDSPPVWYALVESDGVSTYESDTQTHRCTSHARIWYRP